MEIMNKKKNKNIVLTSGLLILMLIVFVRPISLRVSHLITHALITLNGTAFADEGGEGGEGGEGEGEGEGAGGGAGAGAGGCGAAGCGDAGDSSGAGDFGALPGGFAAPIAVATCTVSPASPKVGDTVTWSISQYDATTYLLSGLLAVTQSHFGTNPDYFANPDTGGMTVAEWQAGKTSMTMVYSSPGTQYAGFGLSIWGGQPAVEEVCSVNVNPSISSGPSGACGSANGVSSSVAPSSNLCSSGSASTPVLMCTFYDDATSSTSEGPCGSFGPVGKYDSETTDGWGWTCGSASCTAPYVSAPCTNVTFTQPCSIAPANGIPAGQTSGTALFSQNTCTNVITYVSGCSNPSCPGGGPPVCNPACQ